jgi:hypothetical protein
MTIEESPFDLWEDLLLRFQSGEITREEAEAQSEKAGFGPIPWEPPPTSFNPRTWPEWTLPMALAWIIWRTPEKTREYWNAYRELCLDRRKSASVSDVIRDFAAKNDDGSAESFFLELWSALCEGRLGSSGIPIGGDARVLISSIDWFDFPRLEFPEGEDATIDSTCRYHSVRVYKEHVVALWPPSVGTENAGPPCKQSADATPPLKVIAGVRPSSEADIRKEILAVYAAAVVEGVAIPNSKDMANHVSHIHSTKSNIEKIASEVRKLNAKKYEANLLGAGDSTKSLGLKPSSALSTYKNASQIQR